MTRFQQHWKIQGAGAQDQARFFKLSAWDPDISVTLLQIHVSFHVKLPKPRSLPGIWKGLPRMKEKAHSHSVGHLSHDTSICWRDGICGWRAWIGYLKNWFSKICAQALFNVKATESAWRHWFASVASCKACWVLTLSFPWFLPKSASRSLRSSWVLLAQSLCCSEWCSRDGV